MYLGVRSIPTSQPRIHMKIARASAGDAEMPQRSLALEAQRLQETDRGGVAGHDEGVDPVEMGRVERPRQHLLDRTTHEAAAPVRRREIIGQLGVRVCERPGTEAAGADQAIARVGQGPPARCGCGVAREVASDHGFDGGEVELRKAGMLDDARIGEVVMPRPRIRDAERPQAELAQRPRGRHDRRFNRRDGGHDGLLR